MISCVISAGKYFSKEGKLLGCMLRGRARALHGLWPNPITFETITFASGQVGKEEQGRGTAASFAEPVLLLSTLPPGLPSIPSSLPAGLRRDEARGRPPEQEPVHTSRFQPQDVSPLNSLTAKAFILEKTDLHPQLVLPCHRDFHTSG